MREMGKWIAIGEEVSDVEQIMIIEHGEWTKEDLRIVSEQYQEY